MYLCCLKLQWVNSFDHCGWEETSNYSFKGLQINYFSADHILSHHLYLHVLTQNRMVPYLRDKLSQCSFRCNGMVYLYFTVGSLCFLVRPTNAISHLGDHQPSGLIPCSFFLLTDLSVTLSLFPHSPKMKNKFSFSPDFY